MSNSLRPYGLRDRDSSVHGILQARILEWVAMPSSRGSFRLWDQSCASVKSPASASGFFPTSATWGLLEVKPTWTQENTEEILKTLLISPMSTKGG